MSQDLSKWPQRHSFPREDMRSCVHTVHVRRAVEVQERTQCASKHKIW